MRIEMGSRHTTESQAESVYIVIRYGSINGAEVELTRLFGTGSFYEVLNHSFGTEDDIFESRNLFNPVHEYIHGTFGLTQRYLADFSPVLVTLRQHICLLYNRSFQPEHTRLNGVEFIVAVFRHPLYLYPPRRFYQCKVYQHIVVHQYPVPVGQLLVLLYDVQLVYKVHTCLFRQVHYAFLYGIGRIFQYVQVSCETEVL